MKYIFIFLLIFLSGCGVSSHFDSDSVLDDHNCPWIELPVNIFATNDVEIDAINIWNEQMGMEVFVIPDGGNYGVRIYYDDNSLHNLEGKYKGKEIFSCWNATDLKRKSEIILRNGMSDKETLSILCHELGHVLGMQHTSYGVMQPHVSEDDIDKSVFKMKDYFSELYDIE